MGAGAANLTATPDKRAPVLYRRPGSWTKLPAMPMYSIQTQGELHPFLNQEWLLTNGSGAFSFSTVVGCNTRRYHGLLCAATTPPVGRRMALNRIGELVFLDGRSDFLELSINQFGGSFHPRGDRYLRQFDLDQTVTWHFELEGVKIAKELLLSWQRNAICLRYRIEAAADRQVELHLLPFVSIRDFHALQRGSDKHYDVAIDGPNLAVTAARHTLRFRSDAGQFQLKGDWWYGHFLAIEHDRGLDDTEDLYVPAALVHKTRGPATLTVCVSLDEPADCDFDTELARRPDPVRRYMAAAPAEPEPSPVIARLLRAAADFVVSRKEPDGKPGTTIIAGYPWFADWGRDSMIALPGLLLCTRRFEEAQQVLSVFARYVSRGMIPNRFDDYTNEPSYNTVDASLWFIHACFEYFKCSGDSQTFEKLLRPACRAIVEGYQAGTRYNIHMDADGLIVAGDPGTQLTWMDAKHGDTVFTPRHGKAVEINALWYNALMLMDETALGEKVRQSFVKTFWINPFRGCYDVVTPERKDASVRPNQIFCVSLPHSPLSEDQQHALVETVRRELLTPFGLRTLAKSDPHYRGHLAGGPFERDRAYHNGTVWPWLIGPFLEAYLKVHNHVPDAARQCRVWLQPLIDHMNQACIGQISECFNGDEPHKPVAAPAQAWSVAEVLRIAMKLGF